MQSKGIRGAITVDSNSKDSLKNAVIELISELTKQNNIKTEEISHVIFSVTEDINADFPAKYARLFCGWENVAMMCFNEITVPDSIKMCLRILVVVNREYSFKPKFVYLKGASNLRK